MLRLFRFAVGTDVEAEFRAFLERDGVRAVRGVPGVRRAFVGQSLDDAERWIEVSRWSSVEASMAGPAMDGALAETDEAHIRPLRKRRVLDYEAMDVEPPVDVPAPASLLRVFHGVVPSDRSTAYYEWLREEAWPQILTRPGLVNALHGRRIVPGGHAFAFVSAWRSMDDVRAAVEHPQRPIAFSTLVVEAGIEHFAVIEAGAQQP